MSVLFYRADVEDEYIVSIGLVCAKFKKESNLFDLEIDKKMEKLNEAVYKIRSKFGLSAVITGVEY